MAAGLGRLALCLGLVLSAGFVFVPVGCGGSEAPGGVTVAGDGTPEVPEHTAKELARCVLDGSGPFPPPEGDRYPVDFAVKVSPEGEVLSVDVRHSALRGHGVEACMGGALLGMTLPMRPIAMERRYRAPRDRVAPPARGLLAQPSVGAVSPVALVPLVIAGVAIIAVVTVFVYIVSDSGKSKTTVAPPEFTAAPVASATPSETAEPLPPAAAMATAKPKATAEPTAMPTARPLPIALPKVDPTATYAPPFETELEMKCKPLMNECLQNKQQPKWNQKTFGPTKNCFDCYRICLNKQGEWPTNKCPRTR